MSDSALEALKKLVESEEKRLGIVRVPVQRNYVHCDWCNGRGCTACFTARRQREKELEEEYNRQFPNGPEPIFTARLDHPEEMEAMKRVAGREAIEKAFGPGGRGVEEIKENAAREKAKLSTEAK